MYDLGPISAKLPDLNTGKKPGRMSAVGEIKLSVPESSPCSRRTKRQTSNLCWGQMHGGGSELAYEFGGGRGDAGAVADRREVVARRLAAHGRAAPAPAAATRRGLRLHPSAHGSASPLLCW